jgi:hypothetical protein
VGVGCAAGCADGCTAHAAYTMRTKSRVGIDAAAYAVLSGRRSCDQPAECPLWICAVM